jgi:hypothetical protein
MMRNIMIGLAAATIAIGGSTLSASTLYGQESGKVAGYKPDRFDEISRFDRGNRISRLTPMQRERLRGIVRERYAELTPLQRERLRAKVRERYAQLTPMQRERLRTKVRERFADLTPLQRARVLRFVRARYERLTPLERERLYRQGSYGRR